MGGYLWAFLQTSALARPGAARPHLTCSHNSSSMENSHRSLKYLQPHAPRTETWPIWLAGC